MEENEQGSAGSQETSKAPNVGRASAIMGSSIFISRILAIVRDSILAAKFGRNALTDSYLYAFQIPDLLFFLIAGGALSSAFIPVFSEYLHTNKKEDAHKVYHSVSTIMATILVVIVGLVWIFTEQILHVMLDKSALAANEQLIATMSRILLPGQIAFFLGGLMFGVLYSHQRFSIPALGPNVYNIGIILGALVISHFVSPGITGMAWGALIGAIIGNLIIPYAAMRQLGIPTRISFDVKHPGVKKVFRLMLPVILGLSLPGVYALIMRQFGSGFDKGIVTSLDLSNKLMQAPLGVFGQSFAIAIFPALSQFYAHKQMGAYRAQIEKTMRTAIYISVPIAFIMGFLSHDIITTLFSYGKFAESDPSSVILSLTLFSFGIPAWCLHPILMRGYFAMQQTVKPIVLGTVTTVLFVGLCLTLPKTGLEWRALPIASSISAIFLAILMTSTLTKDAGGLKVDYILAGVVKSICSALPMGILMWIVTKMIPVTHAQGLIPHLISAVRLLSLTMIGFVIYYQITKAWGMQESATISRAVSKLSRKLGITAK